MPFTSHARRNFRYCMRRHLSAQQLQQSRERPIVVCQAHVAGPLCLMRPPTRDLETNDPTQQRLASQNHDEIPRKHLIAQRLNGSKAGTPVPMKATKTCSDSYRPVEFAMKLTEMASELDPRYRCTRKQVARVRTTGSRVPIGAIRRLNPPIREALADYAEPRGRG